MYTAKTGILRNLKLGDFLWISRTKSANGERKSPILIQNKF